jgi:ribosomal protein S27AE
VKNGICPKCGSAEILTEEAGATRDFLPGGNLFNPLHLVNYACGSCGYLESYVVSIDLELLNQKWSKYVPKSKT